MKNQIHLAVAFLLCGAALAGVPVRWTAETSRVKPIALDAWRGDTLALECTLKSYGHPVALGAATASIMWQTNGMGSAWWQTNATVSADGVIRATWSPSMDPGAPAVAFFLPVQTADGASYRAAGTLRFRPSPGAGSQIAQLPQPGGTLDFGEFNLVNAPWATLAAANEAISAAVTSATGALVIPPPVDLGPYATTGYVAGAISTATGALVIPPPVDLSPYATTAYVEGSVQTASNDLSRDIQTAFNSASNRTDLVKANLLEEITSSTNNLRSAIINNISESASETRAYADSVASNAQRSAIAAIPSLSGYATEQYVSEAIGGITIPSMSDYATTAYADAAASNAQAAAIAAIPSLAGYATQSFVADYFSANYTPPDLSSYASRSYADAAASNAQAAAIAAIPSLAGYATQSYVADYFATAYTPPDLSSYASRSYADAAASNAQAAAIAAIPSLAGYATQSFVADYFSANYTPPDLSSYASRSYADAAASNAQAAAIAAIPSLAGYATETYAQNAAADAASDALSAAQSYARDLSWAASSGNTRLVSLDGTIWQDATGTVWQTSEIYGWSGTVIDLSTSAARPITFNYAGKTDTFYTPNADYWSAGGGTNLYFATAMYETWALWFTNTYYGAESNSNWIADGSPPPSLSATNITISTSNEYYRLYYRPVALATNPVDRVLYASDAGDAATAERALTYGTPTRWTDATGCVWEVGYRYDDDWVADSSRITQVSWSPAGYEEDPDLWAIYFMVDGSTQEQVYNLPPWPTQTNLSISASDWVPQYEGAFDFNIYRSPHTTTNLVGRVALTNDLPGAIISTISDFATTGTVHAAESSTYSSRLFDASFDSAYDATYLIRESTNAATSVSSSLVRYALVTPGEWSFSGVPSGYSDPVCEWDGSESAMKLTLQFDGSDFALYDYAANQDSMSALFSWEPEPGVTSQVTATRASLPGHLCDRSVNSLSITSITNITLPALSHPGKARDFILLLDIPSSITNTVPAITNLLTFTASGTETVHFYVDGDDPSATFPLPTSPGTWSYSFSEFKASWFAVSLKPIVEAAAPGGAQ